MKWPLIPATLLLLISLQSCKEDYASLDKDPLKRMKTVKSTDNSELLAEVVIFETDETIRSEAYNRLTDKAYIENRFQEMSQDELYKYLTNEKYTSGARANGCKFLTSDEHAIKLLKPIAEGIDSRIASYYLSKYSTELSTKAKVGVVNNVSISKIAPSVYTVLNSKVHQVEKLESKDQVIIIDIKTWDEVALSHVVKRIEIPKTEALEYLQSPGVKIEYKNGEILNLIEKLIDVGEGSTEPLPIHELEKLDINHKIIYCQKLLEFRSGVAQYNWKTTKDKDLASAMFLAVTIEDKNMPNDIKVALGLAFNRLYASDKTLGVPAITF